jgi:hypothetical protein
VSAAGAAELAPGDVEPERSHVFSDARQEGTSGCKSHPVADKPNFSPVTLQLSRALLTQLLRRLNKLERGDPFRRAAADVRYVS